MLEIYIDGGCQPNPNGVCGYAVVAFRDDVEHWKMSGIVGKGNGMSNNVGEYSALVECLKWLNKNVVPEETVIYSDSQLLVQQMTFNYEARTGSYIKYFLESVRLLTELMPEWKDKIKFIRIDGGTGKHWIVHCMVERRIREYATSNV